MSVDCQPEMRKNHELRITRTRNLNYEVFIPFSYLVIFELFFVVIGFEPGPFFSTT